MVEIPKFMHRQNSDGYWSSICMTCLDTIGAQVKAEFEIELILLEDAHVCEDTKIFKSGGRSPLK